jgi:hypothetical protein
MRPALRWSLMSSVAAALLAFAPQPAVAQSSWEFSPYDVRVWLVAGPSALVSPGVLERVTTGITDRAEIALGAAWKPQVEIASTDVADELLLPDAPPPYARLIAAAPTLTKADVLIAVRIDADERGWIASARQFLVRSRVWDEIRVRTTGSTDQLPFTAWDAVQAAFQPLARVERVDGKTMTARVRAGGLIVSDENPAQIRAGEPLQPILRRNDRAGEPLKGGIQYVPWSVLHADERTDALITGTMHSGLRFPLPSKAGIRTERLAVRIPRPYPATKLLLESRAADRQPLEGYDIHVKAPQGKETQLLGKTNWQGMLEIARAKEPVAAPAQAGAKETPALAATESPLHLLYVRSGGKMVARLPLVPGSVPEATVRLIDDQQRLQADGLVAALHSRVTDLVARREILAVRARGKIKQGKFEEAEKLVNEYRTLETRADLLRHLDEQQPKIRSADKQTQGRIDKSFGDARKLLSKFLDPAGADNLAKEIAQAKNPPPPMPEPAPAPAPTPQPAPMPTPPQGTPPSGTPPATTPATPPTTNTNPPPPPASTPANSNTPPSIPGVVPATLPGVSGS